MDPRRALQHEYGRTRGGDGGGYGTVPSSSGRAIPPTAVPSLSTGQGFYTVESLQGATMVPPPQPAPPPPRLLPPLEPYPRDLPPPRHSERFLPAERGDFGSFDRRYPPSGRKMMMMPHPDMPLARRGEVLRGRGMPQHPFPPYMGNPRMPGFPGRRELPLRGRWGPSDDYNRHFPDRDRDWIRPSQRIRPRKQPKPVPQAKSFSKSAAADKRSPADKQTGLEGGPTWCAVCKIDCPTADSLKMHTAGKKHKKQMESQAQVEGPSEKPDESKNEGDVVTAAAEEGAEKPIKSEVGENVADKGGELALSSGENMVVEDMKGEAKSEATEIAGTPKPANPVAGKKRVIKDVAQSKKKLRKSTVSDDTLKSTAEVKSQGTPNASKVLESTMPDAQMKGADHDPCLKKSADSLGGEVDEPLVSGGNALPSAEEIPSVEDGSKEVREVTDLANGIAGQSAEIQ